MKKVCQTKFYGRFYMKLGRTLKASGQNISGDFTVKWQIVENCLYEAVSDVEGVTRLDNYLNLNHTKFTDATLELLVYDVDREVDAFQGSWDKVRHPGNHTHCLKAKYELVYDIIRNLPDKFSQLKECTKKEISKLYFDPTGIKDIPELQKHLQKNLIEFIKKLDEEKKDNSPVITSKEYLKYIKDHDIKCCPFCFSEACLARYQTAKTLGYTYTGSKVCRKKEQKAWNFGQLEQLKVWEPQERTQLKTKTISIQPKQLLPATNSLVDDLYAFHAVLLVQM